MIRLLTWLSIFEFISAPAFVIASIWYGEVKFVLIAGVLVLASAVTSGFAELVRKQNAGNLV